MTARTGPRRAEREERPDTALTLIRRRSRNLVKRRPHTRLAFVGALAAVSVAALVCLVLIEQVILAQSAFELARIREQTIEANRRNQELLLQMTRLQSPQRIERYARTELGMVDPTSVDYVVADVGGLDDSVAVLHPAARLPAAAGAAAAGAPAEGP